MDNQRNLAQKTGPVSMMSPSEKARIEADFSRHINSGQVKYLKAGHLDVLEFEREGIFFVDPVSGRKFIDCFSSAGSFNVGRHNPEILSALDKALSDSDIGSHMLVSPQKVALAEKLAEVAPGDLNRVHLAAGGGDAVDAAIKLARLATGRNEIISTIKGYHGHTGFSLSANGKEHYRHFFEPLMPDFKFAPFNDLNAIAALASKDTAAIIVEPVQGEAGIYVGSNEFLSGLRGLCDIIGAMLIFDEIQTGFGRTGKMFACQHTGVVPDIMTVAKSLGGSLYPSAAMLYRDTPVLTKAVDEHPDFHPSVMGGSDIACTVSLAVIDFIEEKDLPGNSEKMGAKLRDALELLRRDNPGIIKEVRGVGLMIGIEYIHEFMGPMMSDALAQNGIFAAYSGNAPQVMRFMAPIVINEKEMDLMIDGIQKAVASMKKLLPFALLAAKVPALLQLLNSEKVQTTLFGFIRKVEDAIRSLAQLLKGGAK